MSKKEVVANYSQLRGAFKKHGNKKLPKDTDSEHLLRFYANECGLKAMFIRENRLNDTSDFLNFFEHNLGKRDKKYGHGHNLLMWINEIKAPTFVINYNDSPSDPVEQAHEKLRYGVSVQTQQIEFLKTLYSVIKKHLL
jgi:hypothetical protein